MLFAVAVVGGDVDAIIAVTVDIDVIVVFAAVTVVEEVDVTARVVCCRYIIFCFVIDIVLVVVLFLNFVLISRTPWLH
jgi:hypothetical protein